MTLIYIVSAVFVVGSLVLGIIDSSFLKKHVNGNFEKAIKPKIEETLP